MQNALRTLVIVANTEPALGAESVGPEASELDVSLGELGVGEEEPEAEDWLGEDVEHGVGDDLLVDAEDAASVGNSPDAVSLLAKSDCTASRCCKLTLGRRSR